MSQRQHQRGEGGGVGVGYSEVKVKGMIERFLGAPNFPFWDNFLGQENLASKLGLSMDFLVQSKESEDWCCNVGVCWLQRSTPPSEEKTDNSDGLMKRQS